MSELDLDLDRRPAPTTEDGDHERFAHWVMPASAVTEALVTGIPVVALCGKVWTPTPTGLNGSMTSSPMGPVCDERTTGGCAKTTGTDPTEAAEKTKGLPGRSEESSAVRPKEKRAWLKRREPAGLSSVSERLCERVAASVEERMARLTLCSVR